MELTQLTNVKSVLKNIKAERCQHYKGVHLEIDVHITEVAIHYPERKIMSCVAGGEHYTRCFGTMKPTCSR